MELLDTSVIHNGSRTFGRREYFQNDLLWYINLLRTVYRNVTNSSIFKNFQNCQIPSRSRLKNRIR